MTATMQPMPTAPPMTPTEARRILAAEAKPLGPRLWRVDSASESGVWWTVLRQGATLFCTCPAGMMGRRDCWHRLAVRCLRGEQAMRWHPAARLTVLPGERSAGRVQAGGAEARAA